MSPGFDNRSTIFTYGVKLLEPHHTVNGNFSRGSQLLHEYSSSGPHLKNMHNCFAHALLSGYMSSCFLLNSRVEVAAPQPSYGCHAAVLIITGASYATWLQTTLMSLVPCNATKSNGSTGNNSLPKVHTIYRKQALQMHN